MDVLLQFKRMAASQKNCILTREHPYVELTKPLRFGLKCGFIKRLLLNYYYSQEPRFLCLSKNTSVISFRILEYKKKRQWVIIR